MIKRRLKQRIVNKEGFTIVELMIATMVFSVIMLVAAGVVVRFTNNFQRSLTQTTTQNAARSAMDAVTQAIQYESYGAEPNLMEGGTKKAYCIGATRYTYELGKQLQTDPVFIEEGTGQPGCNNEPGVLSSSTMNKEILTPGMRLARFDISPAGSGLYRVTIRVAYGDKDLLCSEEKGNCNTNVELSDTELASPSYSNTLMCKSQKGSQFCAVSELTTVVKKRL